MSRYCFTSNLGIYIGDFITQKNLLGFPYKSSSRILRNFDAFAKTNYPEATTLTKEMALAWTTLKKGEHPNGLLRRVTPIRQLGKYLTGIGQDAFILPGHIPNRTIHYVPHIYTEEEIQAFFHSLHHHEYNWKDKISPLVVPYFFQLLYCCGMRSSEALFLHVDDVDLSTGRVFIRETKGWKSRIIFMDDNLKAVLCAYDLRVDRLVPQRTAFFPNSQGTFFRRGIQDVWFHIFWDCLGIDTGAQRPRVHDFRHTFAVKKLNQWVRGGKNLNALYPYLSEYMGHKNYADTDYYLHLVSEFYPEMEKRLLDMDANILPEVCHEEE
jgi:integrase/recombinase XerD